MKQFFTVVLTKTVSMKQLATQMILFLCINVDAFTMKAASLMAHAMPMESMMVHACIATLILIKLIGQMLMMTQFVMMEMPQHNMISKGI